ncbi:2-hydroxyacyl-CoA lyase [Pelomyxa schiedti]|nr:2-hydroxyacyl-CoA lyase [Pelomyxa schiedti]
MDGHTLVAKALHACGVRRMFGVVGIPVTQIAVQAQKCGITYVGMRNEQAAGYAACGSSYVEGGVPAVLLTVSGPGAIHGFAGLAHASANCWPLVMISGSCDEGQVGKGAFQELDQIKAASPYCKWSGRATSLADIPRLIATALSTACSGQPGGVYIDLPSNLLKSKVPEESIQSVLNGAVFAPPVCNAAEIPSINEAFSILQTAKHPLLVLGKGAAYARAEVAVSKFVETVHVPFLPTPMGRGVLDDSHPLCCTAARSLALSKSDVVLVVGARLNWILHFGETPRWKADCKFIIVDIAPSSQQSSLSKASLVLQGHAPLVLEQLTSKVVSEGFSYDPRSEWHAELSSKCALNATQLEKQLLTATQHANGVSALLNFHSALCVIRNAIDELKRTPAYTTTSSSATPSTPGGVGSVFVISEGANTMDTCRMILPCHKPRTRLDAGTWGTMGVGVGYSVACGLFASQSNDGSLVVDIEGDSAFGFSAAECEVICRYSLPCVVIVFNNGGIYGGTPTSDIASGNPLSSIPPTSFSPGIRYDKIMEAFGGKGYFAQTLYELQAYCQVAFCAKKPALINVVIDPQAGVESGSLQSHN